MTNGAGKGFSVAMGGGTKLPIDGGVKEGVKSIGGDGNDTFGPSHLAKPAPMPRPNENGISMHLLDKSVSVGGTPFSIRLFT